MTAQQTLLPGDPAGSAEDLTRAAGVWLALSRAWATPLGDVFAFDAVTGSDGGWIVIVRVGSRQRGGIWRPTLDDAVRAAFFHAYPHLVQGPPACT